MKEALGATGVISLQQLSLFFPDKDRNDQPVKKIQDWIDAGVELLGRIGGGSTKLPPAEGAWFNSISGQLILEKTVIVYTYVKPAKLDELHPELRAFLHEFGRLTDQAEVLVHWQGAAYRITEYDKD